MSAINSLMHTFGARPYRTQDDNSRNLGVVAWLAWGEGWHNNHHAFPYSAAFALRRTREPALEAVDLKGGG
jgi:stearoyl-CoA desaturase (delta-9 desaturase)